MGNHIKLSFPARSENERLARTVCAAFAIELDPTVEEMSEIKTAISEAVTNSIIHGYCGGDGTVELEAEINGNEITYTVRDRGCGISDIEKAKEPLYTGSADSERSGMGFSIMEAFTDELIVKSRVGHGTAVTMKKKISDDDR